MLNTYQLRLLFKNEYRFKVLSFFLDTLYLLTTSVVSKNRPKVATWYFSARQCSKRGGELNITVRGDRVELSGKAQIILKGEMLI